MSSLQKVALVEADYLIAVRIHDFSTACDDCATSFLYCVDQQCLESHQTLQPGTKLDFSQEFILLRQNPILFRGSTQTWNVRKIYIRLHGYIESNFRFASNVYYFSFEHWLLIMSPIIFTGSTGQCGCTVSKSIRARRNYHTERGSA